MSIITITSALQGAMFTLNAEEKSKAREIPVGKGVKAAVVLAGHLSAQDVRQQDGSYAPGAFGRSQSNVPSMTAATLFRSQAGFVEPFSR